ncbi:MAG: serine protease [Minwuia sp.]|nr:serine protease [Minwuia sp.]
MTRFSLLLLGLLFCGSALAPDLKADDTLLASAIGRINHAGFRNRSHCTGFVVAGGHVVTAAHCMPGWDGEPVHFLRGYDRGDLAQHISAPRAAWHILRGRDIAVLCNAAPDAPAFGLRDRGRDRRIAPGDDLLIPGYAIPRAHMLQPHHCQLWKLEAGGGIRVACPVRPGTSGAPVLQPDAGGYRVVGVMSASSRTAARADALDADVLAPCAVP